MPVRILIVVNLPAPLGPSSLSRPLPELAERFDWIGSHLVLNDVADHQGFAATLASLARPGARVVLAFNNPYSSVVREHIVDYFAHGALGVYRGMSAQGVKAHYYHRTLEEYLDAFLGTGLRLAKLVDVPEPERPGHRRFPLFMVLTFDRP